MYVKHKSRFALAAVAALGLAAAQPSAAQINTIASFNGTNGQNPAALTFDSLGNLYGTTENGGNFGAGTVFEITPGSSTITTLASFNGANGAVPFASLTFDSLGNLYGTTGYGGPDFTGGNTGNGTVFEVTLGSNTITTLTSFNGTNGIEPLGLISDSLGNFYGTTASGGANGRGTVYEITAGSSTITNLVSFNGTNGVGPNSLILDNLGNLYGTTRTGGTGGGAGTVFEILKGSNTITTVANFNGINGVYPSTLVADSLGNLYGTTQEGGRGIGTVFEVKKGSNTITNIATFIGANGGFPLSLTLDSMGNLYGTTNGTSTGGPNNQGTVFEVLKGSNTITSLAFFNGINGKEPLGLTFNSQGNLYGTTFNGGPGYSRNSLSYGTIFELDNPATSTLTPESSGLANAGGALLALALAGLVTAIKKKARRSQ